MKTPTAAAQRPPAKNGFILFYAMAIVAVLSLVSIMALSSANLESRTATNHYDSVRALYHAEAGTKLVKQEIESRLELGETLSSILSTLSVEAPGALEFDTIDSFHMIVPERLFSFETIGRSGDAMASVVVQYRRRPMMTMGMFGHISITAQNHVSIYGYDSRVIENPTAADNNGGGSIGSNGSITLGSNNFTFDGTILLGESGSGLIAQCNNCDSSDYTQMHIGTVDSDPLGLTTGGTLSTIFDEVVIRNDNISQGINGNQLVIGNGGSWTLTSGNYYLTGVTVGTHGELMIDPSDGPVRIFLDGGFDMGNHTQLIVDGNSPQDFQIYSRSSQEIKVLPHGGLTAFVYAPLAHFRLQPLVGGGDFKGNIWADTVQIQPHGDIFLDTSIADRMLMNNLEIHAWYEQHSN
jgi:hypothetical protein